LNKNIITGIFANMSNVLVNLILVPIYLTYFGPGAYGIVSLIGLIMSFFVIFDAGTGIATINEVSKQRIKSNSKLGLKNLVRSLEVSYLFFSLISFLLIYFFSNSLAIEWFKSDLISSFDRTRYIKLIGVIIMLKWPLGFYNNVLSGLNKINTSNYIKLFFALLYLLVSLLAIVIFHFTFTDYLFAIILLQLVNLVSVFIIVWFYCGLEPSGAKFKLTELKSIWKFALSASIFSILGVFFTLVDKIFVSKNFSLEFYGYYTILSTIGFASTQVLYPITNSYFVLHAEFFQRKKHIYSFVKFRIAVKYILFFLLSFYSFLTVFQDEIFYLWTKNRELVNSIQSIGFYFFVGLFFYGMHNIMLIPLLVMKKIRRVNIVYSITLFIYIILLFMGNETKVVESVVYSWAVACFILFILMSFSLFYKNTFYRSSSSFLSYIVSDYLRPLTVAAFFFIILRLINFLLPIQCGSSFLSWFFLPSIFLITLFLQTFVSLTINERKKIISKFRRRFEG
jgi:O-antigen/teichoic acid export membrane protein